MNPLATRSRRAFLGTTASAAALVLGWRHWFTQRPSAGGGVFDFTGLAGAESWGDGWVFPLYQRRRGVVSGQAFLDLPDGLDTTAPDQPIPAFLLDHDAHDCQQRLAFRIDNPTLRPGLLFAGRGAFDYLAVTAEGDRLVLSQFARTSRRRLASATLSSLKADLDYVLHLLVRGRHVRASLTTGNGASLGELAVDLGADLQVGTVGVLAVHPTDFAAARLTVFRFEVHSASFTATVPRCTYSITGPPRIAGGRRVAALRVGASIPCDVQFEWSPQPDFGTSKRSSWISAAEPPFTATSSAELADGKTYWRARLRSQTSGATTTNDVSSIPAPATSALTLLAGSCVEFCEQAPTYGYRRLREASDPPPALMLYQGDMGYANNRYHSCYAIAEDFFADRFIRFLSDPLFAELRSTVPTGFTLDDHDYGPKNNADRTTVNRWVSPLWQRIGADPSTRGYYDVMFADVHCLTLDGRRYADPITAPNTPEKTKLGAAQRDWLLYTLATSPASLFVILSADIFASRYTVPNSPNIPDCFSSGWPDEYRSLMTVFYQLQDSGRRVLILSGDSHSLRVHYHPRPDGTAARFPIVEFICSGLRPRHWFGAATGDTTVDPRRNVLGEAGAGLLSVDAAASPERTVTLRAISGAADGPADLFPPLTLPFGPA